MNTIIMKWIVPTQIHMLKPNLQSLWVWLYLEIVLVKK
jgi:hypothetical protein